MCILPHDVTKQNAGAVIHPSNCALQFLLVVSSGSIAKSLPIMAAAYFGILRAWSTSVNNLATMHVCAFTTHTIDMDDTSSDSDVEDFDDTLQGVPTTQIGSISPKPSAAPAAP